MIALSPVLIALIFTAASLGVSLWRSKHELAHNSTPLEDVNLNSKFKHLARALDVKKIDVLMLKTDGINGMAAPDGKIYITEGLYDAYRVQKFTDDEIAFVIAHELGHVALGHARRRMADFMMQSVLQTTLTIFAGRFFPRFAAWVSQFIVRLLSSQLMHKDEYEADEYAAALMAKAGLDLSAPMSMLTKLGQNAQRGALNPVWLSSHPATKERVAALNGHLNKWNLSEAPN